MAAGKTRPKKNPRPEGCGLNPISLEEIGGDGLKISRRSIRGPIYCVNISYEFLYGNEYDKNAVT
jgi:hypothetical protein